MNRNQIKQMLSFERKRHKSLKLVNIGGQKAYFRKSESENRPLIVRFHNWSSDYRHPDKIISDCTAELDWNYIHPDFQGSNDKPDACGSPKVLADIESAIDYAIAQGNVDTSKIYVVGASGGGLATLLTFMKSKHKVNTFIAWVPITDVEAWYYESLSRTQKYANDILKCTNSENALNVDEARKRSPLHMEIPKDKLIHSKLKLYAGIHDGYTGAVPITHTINFYNKLAEAFNEDTVSEKDTIYLLDKRKGRESLGMIQGKDVHFYKSFGNVEMTIFEGSHDMLDEHTMEVLTK